MDHRLKNQFMGRKMIHRPQNDPFCQQEKSADKPARWSWTLFRIVQRWATSTELISTIFWIFRFRLESNFVQFDFWVENFIKIGQNWNFIIFLKIRLDNPFGLFGPICKYVIIIHVLSHFWQDFECLKTWIFDATIQFWVIKLIFGMFERSFGSKTGENQ